MGSESNHGTIRCSALDELDRPTSDYALEIGQQSGRWIGFLSYDLGRLFERLPSVAVEDLDVPLFAFAFCRDANGDGEERVESLVAPASRLCPPYEKHSRDDRATKYSNLATVSSADPRSTFTPADYIATVNRVLEYIRAGDIFQANLSQRFTIERNLTPIQIYHNLLQASPARFGGLLDFGDFALICNSPELFLRVATDATTGNRRVITRPIKGTRPRSDGMEQQLRESIKDQAELNMIVDLERNDLGRVCQIASVKVTEAATIETHPTVYHGVATIEGILRPGVGLVDLLRATFPGGSVTGRRKSAPWKSSMNSNPSAADPTAAPSDTSPPTAAWNSTSPSEP